MRFGPDSKKEKDLVTQVSTRFPRATINAAQQLADELDVPLSYIIRQALKAYVHDDQAPPIDDQPEATANAPAETANLQS